MKKVKGFAIFTSICLVILVALYTITLMNTEAVAEFLVSLYSDLTAEPVSDSYAILMGATNLFTITLILVFVLNQIMLYVYSGLVNKKDLDDAVDLAKAETVESKTRIKKAVKKAKKNKNIQPVAEPVKEVVRVEAPKIDEDPNSSVEAFLKQFKR